MQSTDRADFQVLIVDRDNRRRSQMMQWLNELGFRHVIVASAPTSAVTFADSNPPHLLLVGFDAEDSENPIEVSETIQRVRQISRETQSIVYSRADQVGLAQKLAIRSGAWDCFSIPVVTDGSEAGSEALGFCLDRACARLFSQFEIEAWRDRSSALSRTGVEEAEQSRSRLLHAIREFSTLKEFEAVVTAACRLFVGAVGGNACAIYLRWIPIRNAFVVQEYIGENAAELANKKGLGFSPDHPRSVRAVMRNLKQFPELRCFLGEVFCIDAYMVLLHGTPDEPTGLFVISGAGESETILSEIKAVTHLFDLTWGRIQALRDRHTLERIDRGTGLPNKKSFLESLDYEFSRARRFRHPLSVSMVSIGASGGNLEEMLGTSLESVLKVVGASLRRALRATDIVARFEKDQFALIMPHTGVHEAKDLLERAVRATERLKLPTLELMHVERLTVHAALAEYPALVHNSEGFLAWILDLDWSGRQLAVRIIAAPNGFEPEYSPRSGEGLSL